MEKLIQLGLHSVQTALPLLLKDKTTGKNIIWATNSYEEYGDYYANDKQIAAELLTGQNADIIQPRILKAAAEQAQRTKKKAEVFTPAWICNKMITDIDAVWFNRPSEHYRYIFNKPNGTTWKARRTPIWFNKTHSWQRYVDSRRLEITCGEAPYIVSRYDAATGDIIPIKQRVGLLDRKLRAVNENAADETEWLEWTTRAFQSVYGYEFQGDNLLIARINLLMTFEEYLRERWGRSATDKELRKIANIIAWNIWQMDGLTGTIPVGVPEDVFFQLTLEEREKDEREKERVKCRIMNWRGHGSFPFIDIRKAGNGMKFDFAIGNPPYQETTDSDSSRMPPVYNQFMDAAFEIADKVELITPARFLFNAGYTPKAWNEKMLNDEHFKVLHYETDAAKSFANTEIKGGVAITYRDNTKIFGSIGIFTKYNELNHILKKVTEKSSLFLDSIAYPPLSYGLTDLFLSEYPDSLDRLRTSAFTKLSEIFFENKPQDNNDYIQIVGLMNAKRTRRFVKREYIKDKSNILSKWTYIIPEANGNGEFGEKMTAGELIEPDVAFLQTFVGMGAFETKIEAENISKYLKTKFARSLLGVFKITQHCSPGVWKKVPLQDFTPNSDIDWSKPIPEIDKQLYDKYSLDENERNFIEEKVKEMV